MKKVLFDFFICNWKQSFKNICITKREFRNEWIMVGICEMLETVEKVQQEEKSYKLFQCSFK